MYCDARQQPTVRSHLPTTQLSSFYDDDDDDDDHDHDHYHDEDDDDDGGHEDHDHDKMALKATSICLLTTQLHFMKLSSYSVLNMS